jgi:hypothetical protein
LKLRDYLYISEIKFYLAQTLTFLEKLVKSKFIHFIFHDNNLEKQVAEKWFLWLFRDLGISALMWDLRRGCEKG